MLGIAGATTIAAVEQSLAQISMQQRSPTQWTNINTAAR